MIDAAKSALNERLKSPIFGTYFLSFIVVNHDFFLQFHYAKDLEAIQKVITDFSFNAWVPILIAAGYFLLQRLAVIIAAFIDELVVSWKHKARATASEMVRVEVKLEYNNLKNACIALETSFIDATNDVTALQRHISSCIRNKTCNEAKFGSAESSCTDIIANAKKGQADFDSALEDGFYEFK